MYYFINCKSLDFFTRLKLNIKFLEDPTKGADIEFYITNKKKVDSLRVINDVSKRSDQMAHDYVNNFTKDEAQCMTHSF